MRIHRVHLPGLSQGHLVLTGAEALHLSRVLRVRPGQEITAFDGNGLEASGTVTLVEEGRVHLELSQPGPAAVEAGLDVTVAVALLKGDKLADVIRQCTELGAARFQPFSSRHADVPELAPRKLDRLRRVATEAAKQSGRAVVPEVATAIRSTELADLFSGRAVLVADPRAGSTVNAALADRPDNPVLVTGPEGGFAEQELAAFQAAGFRGVQLGARILRAETAPVALLAALLLPEAL